MQTDPAGPSTDSIRVDSVLATATQLTVEAEIECTAPRAEATQVLVGSWPLADTMNGFVTYDAGQTDGLETAGYFGGIFDGRYAYFAPQCNSTGRHGQALRYDTLGPFTAAASWNGYDASATGGLATRGYYGALFDGRYIYYVPRTDGQTHHSRILRLDSCGPFDNPDSWTAHDAGVAVSYQGGAFDGRYLYLAPGYRQDHGSSGLVLRYDTAAAFGQPDACSFFDAAIVGPDCVCYDGAVFDGRHVYFAPLERGVALRHDAAADFADPFSWQAHDMRLVGGLTAGTCVGAVFDGRFIYYVPYAHSVVVRFDTATDFDDPSGWQSYDAAGTSGLPCRGYDGAAFDGRYIYFIPFWNGDANGGGFHAQLLRYDTCQDFTTASAWQAADGSSLAPPNPGGFNGGLFDGRFLYMIPWRCDAVGSEIAAHGHVLRYDTAATAASFSLKYSDCGHNGGLGGALPGPVFTVNTGTGPVSAQAHCPPPAGRHVLTGTYDGRRARLLLDGQVIGERDGGGTLVAPAVALTVGSLAGGAAAFTGSILRVRLAATAISAGTLADGDAPVAWQAFV